MRGGGKGDCAHHLWGIDAPGSVYGPLDLNRPLMCVGRLWRHCKSYFCGPNSLTLFLKLLL
jgi:hypothetical protein